MGSSVSGTIPGRDLRLRTMTEENKSVAASVVIPCYNCADVVGDQLTGLADQEFARPWEVLLVDNGSTDDLAAAVAPFKNRLPGVRIVMATDARGAAHARNVGARAARGDVLLFADADDVVGAGWLAAMVKALETHAFVACRMDFDKLNAPTEGPARRRSIQQEGLQSYTYPDFLPHAAGGTLGVRREVHEAVGGFDTSLLKLQDTDYCWRIQLAGYDMAFVPDAVIHYRLRETLSETWRQAFRYGEYNVKLYQLYKNKGMGKISVRRGLRGWYYLVRQLPRLFQDDKRSKVVWNTAWRLGRLYGSVRYRVFAL